MKKFYKTSKSSSAHLGDKRAELILLYNLSSKKINAIETERRHLAALKIQCAWRQKAARRVLMKKRRVKSLWQRSVRRIMDDFDHYRTQRQKLTCFRHHLNGPGDCSLLKIAMRNNVFSSDIAKQMKTDGIIESHAATILAKCLDTGRRSEQHSSEAPTSHGEHCPDSNAALMNSAVEKYMEFLSGLEERRRMNLETLVYMSDAECLERGMRLPPGEARFSQVKVTLICASSANACSSHLCSALERLLAPPVAESKFFDASRTLIETAKQRHRQETFGLEERGAVYV